MAITREEVLHVARLARLELHRGRGRRASRSSSRRSSTRSRRSRSSTSPTCRRRRTRSRSSNVWAEDEPRASLPLDEVVRERARPRRPLLPRPARMTSTRCASRPRRRCGLLERGEVSPAELWDAYRAAIDARDAELNAFLTLVDEPDGDGVPIALKDVISTKGIRTTAGSKILDDYVPVFDSTVAARCKAAGPAVARQDEHRRVRDGLLDRELRVRADAQPVGPLARAGRLGRRLGGRGRGRARALGARLRHRRLGQAAVGVLRQRRPAARPTAPSRATGSSPSPRASTRSAR